MTRARRRRPRDCGRHHGGQKSGNGGRAATAGCGCAGGRDSRLTAAATRIFIKPGHQFRAVDAMLTNFHLPESTLLMLCSAFVGREALLAAYAHAVQARYRFFSYGDAMFLTPSPSGAGAAMNPMRFELLAQDGAARRGRLIFARGTVETPAFMPVGTYGTVKAMTPEDLEAIGAEIVLGNTFHLYLRPGLEVIRGPSGTAPLHALAAAHPHRFRRLSSVEPGARCARSPRRARISARRSTARPCSCRPRSPCASSARLAADVAMSFDECTPYPATEAQARASMELSMRWALRGFREYYRNEPPGTLFGIVQGGIHAGSAARVAGGAGGDRLRRARGRRPRGGRDRGGARTGARAARCRTCRRASRAI